MTARSWLYVPGDQPNMLSGAEDRGADALIVDLEDAVVPANKQEARRVVSDWLESRTSGTGGCDVWVRVNPGALLEADVDAATRPGVSGLCLAKTSGPRDVEVLDRLLARA
jgi:citrate lyase subunit beta/citryl-CoA lyase